MLAATKANALIRHKIFENPIYDVYLFLNFDHLHLRLLAVTSFFNYFFLPVTYDRCTVRNTGRNMYFVCQLLLPKSTLICS